MIMFLFYLLPYHKKKEEVLFGFFCFNQGIPTWLVMRITYNILGRASVFAIHKEVYLSIFIFISESRDFIADT